MTETNKLFLTAAEVAAMLGVCTKTVYEWAKPGGKLKAKRFGDGPRPMIRFRPEDIQAFIDRGMAE